MSKSRRQWATGGILVDDTRHWSARTRYSRRVAVRRDGPPTEVAANTRRAFQYVVKRRTCPKLAGRPDHCLFPHRESRKVCVFVTPTAPRAHESVGSGPALPKLGVEGSNPFRRTSQDNGMTGLSGGLRNAVRT